MLPWPRPSRCTCALWPACVDCVCQRRGRLGGGGGGKTGGFWIGMYVCILYTAASICCTDVRHVPFDFVLPPGSARIRGHAPAASVHLSQLAFFLPRPPAIHKLISMHNGDEIVKLGTLNWYRRETRYWRRPYSDLAPCYVCMYVCMYVHTSLLIIIRKPFLVHSYQLPLSLPCRKYQRPRKRNQGLVAVNYTCLIARSLVFRNIGKGDQVSFLASPPSVNYSI